MATWGAMACKKLKAKEGEEGEVAAVCTNDRVTTTAKCFN